MCMLLKQIYRIDCLSYTEVNDWWNRLDDDRESMFQKVIGRICRQQKILFEYFGTWYRTFGQRAFERVSWSNKLNTCTTKHALKFQ